MHTRIAITLLTNPATLKASAGLDALGSLLTPEGFILDGGNLHHATLSANADQTSQAAPDRLLGTHLRAIARRARAQGASHLFVIRHWSSSVMTDIPKLVSNCLAHPEAVIIGSRPPVSHAGIRKRWAREKSPRFWLKLQTGRHLNDPLCALRIYPLEVIENLNLYQQGTTLNKELLVKSAWADVPFQEVPIGTDRSVPTGEQETLWEPVWRFLLNIHYTLRSVLPVPHRKLVASAGPTGAKISVWRPMRSLRTLLRENTSPTQLAIAVAMGVFFGTLPLIACHSLVIILAANYFRLNKIASLSASQLCMPPVVPALCIETGYFLRHGHFLTEISLETLGYQALERLYEWLLGSLVLAPFLAILVGGAALLMARFAARSMATVRNFKPTSGNGASG
jgi:uncharacterized protein (DUF2062 family)